MMTSNRNGWEVRKLSRVAKFLRQLLTFTLSMDNDSEQTLRDDISSSDISVDCTSGKVQTSSLLNDTLGMFIGDVVIRNKSIEFSRRVDMEYLGAVFTCQLTAHTPIENVH